MKESPPLSSQDMCNIKVICTFSLILISLSVYFCLYLSSESSVKKRKFYETEASTNPYV